MYIVSSDDFCCLVFFIAMTEESQGKVHFPEDQLMQHDSEIIVKREREDRIAVHLGFLQVGHIVRWFYYSVEYHDLSHHVVMSISVILIATDQASLRGEVQRER